MIHLYYWPTPNGHKITLLLEEAQIPYQKLIDLYLLDCVKKRKKLSLKWAA